MTQTAQPSFPFGKPEVDGADVKARAAEFVADTRGALDRMLVGSHDAVMGRYPQVFRGLPIEGLTVVECVTERETRPLAHYGPSEIEHMVRGEDPESLRGSLTLLQRFTITCRACLATTVLAEIQIPTSRAGHPEAHTLLLTCTDCGANEPVAG